MARFTVRARTIDMLGRQQVAGIPTAISELFKNAHDAYARNVEVDYWRSDGLFMLRDDGLGMTTQDFQERWLSIGTESKLDSGVGLAPPPRDADQPLRPVLGEKGIGRLAIATIGDVVLVLSRAKRDRELHDLVVALIHWDVFSFPGINLDDIEVPVETLPGGSLPNAACVRRLADQLSANLDELSGRINRAALERLKKGLVEFDLDPETEMQDLGEPTLLGNGHGTHFLIRPTDTMLERDIEDRDEDNKATRLEKNLIGFTNTMTPDHTPPPIVARFRDHPDEGDPIERIGDRSFFTPEEFSSADHHVRGRFDEYGQFSGTIEVYQTQPDSYVCNWDKGDGLPTSCGPFDFNFAYIQGNPSDSLLPPQEHARMRIKLDRFGGLYIYKNGIRVLPYGDSDYDFLDVERRRTLGAGYYFYSYRRMFGLIQLTNTENGKLNEKAGREGFRENIAYRQFRSILINFFVQSARDFFRDAGARADTFVEKRAELQRSERIRRRRERSSRSKRTELENAIEAGFRKLGDGEPESTVAMKLVELRSDVSAVLRRSGTAAAKASALVAAEQTARQRIDQIRSDLVVRLPSGVGLPKKVHRDFAAYGEEMNALESRLFEPAIRELHGIVSKAADENEIPLDHMARVTSQIELIENESSRSLNALARKTADDAAAIRKNAVDEARAAIRHAAQAVQQARSSLEELQRDGASSASVADEGEIIATILQDTVTLQRGSLEKLQERLSAFRLSFEDEEGAPDEVAAALEEELSELRERRDADFELIQIGMALNIVGHEFDKLINAIRNGIRRLKGWVDTNPDLSPVYDEIRIGFDHLDGYLTLFTPFNRRLYRRPIEIAGSDIKAFVARLFEDRLGRHGVRMDATSSFLHASVHGFPSTFFPAFVNLIDNAIFWLDDVRDREKMIVLDYRDGAFIVEDNGPGIRPRDREHIFELNFSRKPGGRGMGLYICREILSKEGYRLQLDDKHQIGARFLISPMAEDEENELEGD